MKKGESVILYNEKVVTIIRNGRAYTYVTDGEYYWWVVTKSIKKELEIAL